MSNFITRHIPNTLTSLNLVSGCIAIIIALEGNFQLASLFIVIGAIFDFFDGMSARVLKSYSDIGKELDSLADVVTFGVAPSMMVFTLLKGFVCPCLPEFLYFIIPYMAFMLAIFSALSLSKFNIVVR